MLQRIAETKLRRKLLLLGIVFALCLIAVFAANNARLNKVMAFKTAGAGANYPVVGSFDPGDWVNASPVPTARANAAASFLPSGKLLVVGGSKVGQNFVADAAIYDPMSNTWQTITPIPIAHRLSAQLLNSGEVLVVGDDDVLAPNPSSFLFTEGSSSWNATTGTPSIKRYQPALALLTTGTLAGQVLMIGGYDGGCCTGPNGTYKTTELYNPTAKTWSAGPAMNVARLLHTATVLTNGQVLVAGGAQRDPLLAYNSAELYTSGGGSWTLAAPMTAARYAHTATRLPSGEVLVVGGANGVTALNSVELYNPTSNTWSTKTPMTVARQLHTATLLPSGKVLVAGGQDINSVSTDSAELYDPATNTWSDAGPLNAARGRHIAALLSCGRVLIAGGTGTNGADLAAAEIYTQKDPFITITPTTLGIGTVGQMFMQDFLPTGGMGPFTYSLSGTLPKGMTLQSDGKLTGIPEEKGSFTFTVNATDKNGCMGMVTIIWQVDCPFIVISPSAVHNGVAGQVYSPIEQLMASGGSAPYGYAFTSGLLPNGMQLTNDGKLQGTPIAAGTFSFGVTVTDKFGCTGVRNYTLTIGCDTISITPANMQLPNAMQGMEYNPTLPPGQTFNATGGCGQYTFAISGGQLPPGMSLSASGALSGVPTKSGDYEFTVKVTDKCGCMATKVYKLKVTCPFRSLLNQELFNTGVNDSGVVLADGTKDPHYNVTPPGDSAFVVTNDPGWIPNSSSTASKWISPTANTNGEIREYSYKAVFSLSNCEANSAVIQGRWAADNRGAIYLNGTKVNKGEITVNTGFAQWQSFTINSGNAGFNSSSSNTLEFRVTNAGGATGLRVEFQNAVAKCCGCTPPPRYTDMISWWPFDGNANDIRGGYHGTAKDDGGTYPQGMVNQGWRGIPDSQIPTNGGYVEVPDDPGLSVSSTNSFSLDAWIYIDQFTDCNTPIVWKGNQKGQTVTTSVSLLVTGDKASQCSDSINPHRLLVLFSDGTVREELESDSSLVTGQWIHVATTVSSSEVKLYINGLLDKTAARKGNAIQDTIFPLQIGAFAGDTGVGEHFFNGIIDEVEFWRQALTEDELRNIYSAFSDGKCRCVPPPRYDRMISWHPLDEGTLATTIQDIRGPHNGQPKVGPVNFLNSPTATPGVVNGSLYFNGEGAFPHVEVPHATPLNLASNEGFTIDAWINIDQLQTDQKAPIVDKIGFTGNFQPPISGYAFYVQQIPSGNQLVFDIAANNGNAFSATGTVVNVLTPGKWHHVAISYDRNNGSAISRFYVDGQQVVSSGSPANDKVVNTLPLLIGRTRYTNDPDRVGGIKIDELEIFDVPLTQDEIDSIFRAGSAGKCRPNSPSPCAGINITLTNQPNPLPIGTAGTAYPDTQFTATGGTAPYMYTATGLPPGLSLSMDGKLTGTPTQQGNYTIVITVKDANGCTAEIRREISVKCREYTIKPDFLPSGFVGSAYPKQTFTTDSTCPPVTYTANGLPPGLSFANGMLQGTPTQAGSFTVTVSTLDACGCPSRKTYLLVIKDCPRVPLRLFNTGVDNNKTPLTVGVPDGHYTLTTQNGATTTPIVITPANGWVTSPNARWIGGPVAGTLRYATQFDLLGCDLNSVSISGRFAASLNGQLFLNNSTTPIVQTPVSGATSFTNFTITSGFQVGPNTLTFVTASAAAQGGLLVEFTEATARCCACPTITIGPNILANPFLNQNYGPVALTATGGMVPYTYSIIGGALPTGMTFSSGGVLAGKPTLTGNFSFRVLVVDGMGCTGIRDYRGTVQRRMVLLTTNVVQSASLAGEQPRPMLMVNVMLNSTSSENRWTFGIAPRPVGSGLQPSPLSNPRAMAGPDAANGQLTVNTSQISQNTLGLEIRLPSGQTLSGGQRHIFTLMYDIAPTAIGSLVNFEFLDAPVPRAIYDVAGNVLEAEFLKPPVVLAQAAASVSAASYNGERLAPEEIVAAFGTGLATSTQIATTLPLPTTLAGTTVRVRDSAGTERQASLFFVAPTQINYLVPAGTAAGTATVLITSSDGTMSGGAVEIGGVAPGIFVADASGRGLPAGNALTFKADGAQSSQPVARFDAASSRFVAVPIDLGAVGDRVFLSLFGTGVRNRSSLDAVRATIGGIDAPVLYAGDQGGFAGLDQLNIEVPRALTGQGLVDVVITVNGVPANVIQVSIQ